MAYYLVFDENNKIIAGTQCLTDNSINVDKITFDNFNNGTPYKIVDGIIEDISQTPEYLAEQKIKKFQSAIQYQHDAFNEYAREIVYQIQYNTALGNTTLVTSLNNQLQTEQQAVIARINAITEAYNNAST